MGDASSRQDGPGNRSLGCEAGQSMPSPSALNCSSESSIAAEARLSSRCSTLDVPGMRRITGDRFNNQARASWGGVASSSLLSSSSAAGRAQLAVGQRKPRDERDVAGLDVLQQRLRAAIRQVVQVLHRGDWGGLLGLGQLLDIHLGQADVAHLPLVLQQLELTHLLVEGHPGVDACTWNSSIRSSRGGAD